jgi:hypothetical protein
MFLVESTIFDLACEPSKFRCMALFVAQAPLNLTSGLERARRRAQADGDSVDTGPWHRLLGLRLSPMSNT